ncbi:MAG: MBL fold metallo-hydrolase [Oscillospiraceae bacterium]|nr:MBL fold metallo-hydrolase [Oscillospiraceae bacterium]
MPKLFYQGHGSFRLTADDGRVIYVDPYAGGGYDMPADIILVSHQHGDHNQTQLCAKKPNCKIISNAEALEGGKHNSFDVGGVMIQAVEAYNKNHKPEECVGFIITLDGVKIYACGDTSKTEQMKTFAAMNLDYAVLCGDGVYIMNPEEAAECAKLIGAKHNILVHVKPKELFDREIAEAWDAPNKIIIEPDGEISLFSGRANKAHDCPCTRKGECQAHGDCFACVANHRKGGYVPACFRQEKFLSDLKERLAQ